MDGSQKEGGNFFNLLQKEGVPGKGRGSLGKGGFQRWRKLCTKMKATKDASVNGLWKEVESYQNDESHFEFVSKPIFSVKCDSLAFLHYILIKCKMF